MIQVETTDESVRVTIPKTEIPPDRLHSFIDWLPLEATARQSLLAEDEAEEIAEEAKRSWWAANQHRFIKSDQS